MIEPLTASATSAPPQSGDDSSSYVEEGRKAEGASSLALVDKVTVGEVVAGELVLAPQSLLPEENPVAVYLASLSPGSRRAMRGALETMARLLSGGRMDALSLDWGELRYGHTAAVRAALDEKYAPAMANKCLAALRGVLKAAWRLGQIPTDDYQRAADIPSVRGESLPRGRALSRGELHALFAVCAEDNRIKGARDAALLAVLYGGGLRRSEAVALDVEDYEPEGGVLTVRSGKGRKPRVVYLTHGGKGALEEWLAWRGGERSGLGGGEGGPLLAPLFLPVLKSGRLIQRRLSDQAVRKVLRERTLQAGVKVAAPHDMRRSFISHLLEAGADISTVQKLAGHANVSTTTRYDRRGEAAKQKAAELLHVPWEKARSR